MVYYVEPGNTQDLSTHYIMLQKPKITMLNQAIHRRGHCNTFQYSQQNIVLWCTMYIVLCCTRQFTGGAATTIPTNHYVVLLCTRQYRKHCNTLQYSLQNTLLWCTLYYVVPGNSRTGGAATTIPAYKTHNSVCTVVYYGALL